MGFLNGVTGSFQVILSNLCGMQSQRYAAELTHRIRELTAHPMRAETLAMQCLHLGEGQLSGMSMSATR